MSTSPTPDGVLKPTLSVFDLVAINVSAVTPASSVFVIAPFAIQQAGSGVFLAFVMAGLLALMFAFCYAELATRLPEDGGDRRLLGTSGTVTTLASVYLKLNSYDRRAVDGLHLPTAAMRDISRELARRNIEGRAEFPTIGHERADLVVAGCAILETIFDIWPGERLGVADRGIREGILRALMASDAKRRNRRN